MRYQMNLPDAPGPRPGGVSFFVEKKVDNIVDDTLPTPHGATYDPCSSVGRAPIPAGGEENLWRR